MLHSMTGYGRAEKVGEDKKVIVELRSLNSKNFDVRAKLPEHYKIRELELRRVLSDRLRRGKVDLTISILNSDGSSYAELDERTIINYYHRLHKIADDLGAEKTHILPTILQLPDIISRDVAVLGDDEWEMSISCLSDAADQLVDFREIEGKALQSDLKQRVILILSYLDKVANLETDRLVAVRNRLDQHLKEFVEKEEFNQDRYEQEVLYYMEKIDITEERVRLRQHCDYFLDILMQKQLEKGRKLNFISQEMGREINTLGAKANFSEIQHVVVMMKDELEKIKEQISNVV